MRMKLSEQIEVSIDLMAAGLDRPSIYAAINRDEFGGKTEAEQRRINNNKQKDRLHCVLYGIRKKANLWAGVQTDLIS